MDEKVTFKAHIQEHRDAASEPTPKIPEEPLPEPSLPEPTCEFPGLKNLQQIMADMPSARYYTAAELSAAPTTFEVLGGMASACAIGVLIGYLAFSKPQVCA